jgi:predicted metal-dependent HD superfamily phosphohydrolase
VLLIVEPSERWSQTWEALDRPAPPGLIEGLVSAYGEPHRAYHTLQHLSECFGQLDGCPTDPVAAGLLELALWFHDAIYDTKAADNEAQSAVWAHSALACLPADDVAIIEQLILVTKHDATPASADEELLLDIDLSILGTPEARFAEYETQVRQEYAWVPEAAYRTGRAKILREFQERPVIYHTSHFRDALENQARLNLASSLASLVA